MSKIQGLEEVSRFLGRKAGILGHSMAEMKAPRSYFFC
jgi:hypothetical protein